MKKYSFTISTILFLVLGLTSCSNEETKTQNQAVSRPTVPIQNGEVQIGTQVWMTKNLNVSRYRNGDPIPQVTDLSIWVNLTSGAWCYYANNSSNGVVYGKLYNWYAVNDPRGLAPVGYHIPSDAEWSILTIFLGGENVAGGKMKATTLWDSPNTAATNSSGFSGLPSGLVNPFGQFYGIGSTSYWWSTSLDSNMVNARYRYLENNTGRVSQGTAGKNRGFSVRCIKD
jgi:uncharacterized protein (TIGR02145 family)